MDRSPLLEAQAAAGARLGARPEAPDHDAVLTFGDVPAEYAAAREGTALFDASDRARVTVRGGERASFLHRLLANDVRGLESGAGNRTCLLTPKGKVRWLGELEVDDEELRISLPPGTEAGALQALDMFLFTEDVQLSATGSGHAPVELVGPSSGALLAEVLELDDLEELAPYAWRSTAQGVRVTRLPFAGLPGWRVDAGPEGLEALVNALRAAGATPAGVVARDILRVEEVAPLYGIDVDENIYPAEAGLEDAFSLDKGCYIGQEVAAKIDTYGGLNKRLMRLSVDHDDPLPRGTRLVSEDSEARELGFVTSWAYSFQLDTGNVLAYVKRRHQEPGTRFGLRAGENSCGVATVL